MNRATTLNQKLDQYSRTVRGQTAGGKVTELAGYAAAAGASLAMAGAADAAIIYSGVLNTVVEIDQATGYGSVYASAPIDMDGGGADLVAKVLFFAQPGQSRDKYFGYAGLLGTGNFLTGTGGNLGGFKLSAGATIGPGGLFGTNGVGKGRYQPADTSAAYSFGSFGFDTTGFVGVRLASGNFGWIRMRIEDTGKNPPSIFGAPLGDSLDYPDRLTIIDWAYDDSGAAIRAGDTGEVAVPEPSPLALLAAGAAGISTFRRLRAKTAIA